ncbi:hypothetical protein CDAR_557321 [Caerostris darwini]|uniref:Ankyrin repeat protein FPV162 n=1 Tax=Caerostris darwini TaxID=1538125 RepID=A0AAV4P3A5_9ARAC|nr:ankyrin repeat protein FPV162 [Caerostris darwini]GIX91645.1 hypothetical protein CDAR_557321 [Caerostris darwini]
MLNSTICESGSSHFNELLTEFYSSGAKSINDGDTSNDRPLHYAVKSHLFDEKDIAMFITMGADLNVTNNEGRTPLHEIARSIYCKSGIAKMLLFHGANPHTTDNNGYTAFHHLATCHAQDKAEQVDIGRLLLLHGADINAPNYISETPLHLAVLFRNLNFKLLRFFATHGARANIPELKLPLALLGNRIRLKEITEILADTSTDVNAHLPATHRTALHLAIENPNCRSIIVRTLLSNGADVNARDLVNSTPLHYAVSRFHYEDDEDDQIRYEKEPVEDGWEKKFSVFNLSNSDYLQINKIKLLLEFHANINAKDNFGQTPLHNAVKNIECSLRVFKILLQNGANVNAVCNVNSTALQYAVQVNWNNEDVILELLNQGADPNIMSGFGMSALHHSVRNPCCDLIVTRALLDKGADVNIADPETKYTPLLAALEYKCKLDHIQLLLERGAFVNTEEYSLSPLSWIVCSRYCELKVVKEILKHMDSIPPNVNAWLFFGVVRNGCSAEVIEELVKAGVNINAKDSENNTPLNLALDEPIAKMDVIRSLLKNGARASIPTGEEEYPWGDAFDEIIQDRFSSRDIDFIRDTLKYAICHTGRGVPFQLFNSDRKLRSYIRVLKELRVYQYQCIAEIESMTKNLLNVSTCLFTFLRLDGLCYSPGQLNRILEIVKYNFYPIYSDLIARKISKELLIEKLITCKVYMIDKFNQQIILNPYCVKFVATHLSNEDLFSCIRAFYVF